MEPVQLGTLLDMRGSDPVRVAPVMVLREEQEAELAKLTRSRRLNARLSKRAGIVLLAGQGPQKRSSLPD